MLPHGILLKRLSEHAVMPSYATLGDAGMDLTSIELKFLLPPGETTQVQTGWAMAIPPGFVGLITPRSGLAYRGLTVANAPGVIDSGYRGEIQVLLANRSSTPQLICQGMRIAQMLFQTIESGYFQEVDELPPSVRGTGGFGSTGA